MNTSLDQMQLHLRADGKFDLHKPGADGKETFDTLLEALNFAHSICPHTDYHLSVFDAEGRKIIETFV